MNADVTVVSLSIVSKRSLTTSGPGAHNSQVRNIAALRDCVWACWNPETRFHFKTEVLRLGRVGKLHRFVCILGTDPSADKRRVFITFWGMAGQ